MIVQVVNPAYPEQIWYIGNVTCVDGTPWDSAYKRHQAKQFKSFAEIGEALDKFVARFPTPQKIIIECD